MVVICCWALFAVGMRHHWNGHGDWVGVMIKLNVKGLTETINKFQHLQKDIQDKALVSAVNKTATQTRNFIVKKIRQTYTIQSSELKEKINLRLANKKFIKATIIGEQKRGALGITKYRVQITKKGISVWIKRGSKAIKFEDTFPGWRGNEKDDTFQRYGEMVIPKQGRYAGKTTSRGPYKGWGVRRQNIRKLFGPSVRDLMNSIEVYQAAIDFADQKLPELALKELKFYTNKYFGSK